MSIQQIKTIDGIIEDVETSGESIHFSIGRNGAGEPIQRYSIPFESQAEYALRQKPFARIQMATNGPPSHVQGMSLYDLKEGLLSVDEIIQKAPTRVISITGDITSVTYLRGVGLNFP